MSKNGEFAELIHIFLTEESKEDGSSSQEENSSNQVSLDNKPPTESANFVDISLSSKIGQKSSDQKFENDSTNEKKFQSKILKKSVSKNSMELFQIKPLSKERKTKSSQNTESNFDRGTNQVKEREQIMKQLVEGKDNKKLISEEEVASGLNNFKF